MAKIARSGLAAPTSQDSVNASTRSASPWCGEQARTSQPVLETTPTAMPAACSSPSTAAVAAVRQPLPPGRASTRRSPRRARARVVVEGAVQHRPARPPTPRRRGRAGERSSSGRIAARVDPRRPVAAASSSASGTPESRRQLRRWSSASGAWANSVLPKSNSTAAITARSLAVAVGSAAASCRAGWQVRRPRCAPRSIGWPSCCAGRRSSRRLFDPDEAAIGVQGMVVRSGGTLYRDIFDRKPPLPPLALRGLVRAHRLAPTSARCACS